LIYDKLRYLDRITFIEIVPEIRPLLDVSTKNIKARENELYHNVWSELGFTGAGVNIAIIDGGSNDNEIAGDIAHESLDDMDDDLYTYDPKFIAGWDFEILQGGEYINPHGDPAVGHGTHVAGTALGTGGQGEDSVYRGVAPGAQLIDVKAISDAGFGGYVIQAMEWCIDNKDRDWTTSDTDGIQIMSLSIGGSDSDGSDTASLTANRCVEAGIVVVAAAGNGGEEGIDSPAAADKVISVGASDDKGTVTRDDDEVYSGSDRGPRADDGDNDPYDELKPDLIAPGHNIMAPRADSYAAYVSYSGTSMATPHVSGVVALMLEANPDLTSAQVKEILHQSAEARGNASYPELSEKYNTDYGYGIVDAYNAVKAALDEEPQGNKIEIEITNPRENDEVSGIVKIEGYAGITGNDTIESVSVRIIGEWREATGTENWYYEWDSREVENGNITITAQASAENGSKVASVTLKFFVNNTGEIDDDDSDDFLEVEDFTELNEITGSIIGVAVLAIIGTVLIKRKKKPEDEEDERE
ncbi:MAG: S8 family serine peptidase, partial [Thermoplasmata archaeon]|nr:S8 family serine peptidase [Thermoplasmata archaeon]